MSDKSELTFMQSIILLCLTLVFIEMIGIPIMNMLSGVMELIGLIFLFWFIYLIFEGIWKVIKK